MVLQIIEALPIIQLCIIIIRNFDILNGGFYHFANFKVKMFNLILIFC